MVEQGPVVVTNATPTHSPDMRIKNIMQPVAFTQHFGRYIAAALKVCVLLEEDGRNGTDPSGTL